MLVLAGGLGSATYTMNPEAMTQLPESVEASQLAGMAGKTFDSDVAFEHALADSRGA